MLQIIVYDQLSLTQAIVESSVYAKTKGFPLKKVEYIKTIVSELGTNLLKYASRGSIKVTWLRDRHPRAIQIESIDRGPGIQNLELAMKDNYSTGNTLGLGIPGIKRMSDEFEIDSVPDQLTRVISRIFLD